MSQLIQQWQRPCRSLTKALVSTLSKVTHSDYADSKVKWLQGSFYDECLCLWASNQKNSKHFIERRNHQPNTSLAYPVFKICRSRESDCQVGCMKEAEKNIFLDFIMGSAKLNTCKT